MNRDPVDVGLFVTCLVELFRPSVGFAAVTLPEQAGCRARVPAWMQIRLFYPPEVPMSESPRRTKCKFLAR